MVKRKFKVGERYKSGMFSDNGAVIEITEINGDFVSYKDVVRETTGRKVFEIGSIFSDNLEKVEKVEKGESETIVIYRKDNKVIALDKSTGEKAEVKCNPADEFDFRTGAKLAFNRLMCEDNGVREVKRKAKVGEYIKIVDEKSITGIYKNGDICMVIIVTDKAVIMEKDGLLHGCAGHEEYVVLENYKPEEKEEDDSVIHVGDMVEVTHRGHCYSTYDTWSGLGSYRQNYVYGVSAEDGMVAKVLNIANDDEPIIIRKPLALIQNPKTSQVFIIRIDGIKKVER